MQRDEQAAAEVLRAGGGGPERGMSVGMQKREDLKYFGGKNKLLIVLCLELF